MSPKKHSSGVLFLYPYATPARNRSDSATTIQQPARRRSSLPMSDNNQQPLRELIKRNQWDGIGSLAEAMHVQDVAAALEGLPAEVAADAIRHLPDTMTTGAFSYLPASEQHPILRVLDDQHGRR